MKVCQAAILTAVAYASKANAAFVPASRSQPYQTSPTVLRGYLDDLNEELYKESAVPDVDADKRENNKMARDEISQYGPGNLNDFVDFDEFDGGDGQQGVAGDGQQGLDKSDFNTGELVDSQRNKSMSQSKQRSAKNAWGSSTGYAQQMIEEKGMDVAKAQQLENWHNQREILAKSKAQQAMAESFEVTSDPDADWRALAKFGVERNEEFNLDEAFGQVVEGGNIEGTLEFSVRSGGVQVHELAVENEYMGFADFRASLTPDTPDCYTLTPTEGNLQKGNPTNFVIRYKPNNMGTFTGALVIETEDFKKTWRLIGTTG